MKETKLKIVLTFRRVEFNLIEYFLCMDTCWILLWTQYRLISWCDKSSENIFKCIIEYIHFYYYSNFRLYPSRIYIMINRNNHKFRKNTVKQKFWTWTEKYLYLSKIILAYITFRISIIYLYINIFKRFNTTIYKYLY